MPKAFSQSSICFDHNPYDSELTCLLGNASWLDEILDPGPLEIRDSETNGVLTASPWLLPVKWVVSMFILADVAFTCVICLTAASRQNNPDSVFWPIWFVLLLTWFVGLPVSLYFLFLFNRYLAKDGDYFKVDRARRTLELCRVGRTLKADEIIAFTKLSRWHRWPSYGGKWKRTHQTGVLVRIPNRQVELHPLVTVNEVPLLGTSLPLWKASSSWAERLANIFQVPVRGITLSKAASRELKDC
jgi:hypothetical protein